ncbi:hypothetical protein B296_00026224 [Ensete ventricosum]|uniref:Uncharacterized protein n=1 Tax=Ensete ventricosum TaxID=4639 RepID=A0A426XYG0_ENSVE|nr:hypothetical protein B296_00026224 [Ensete ventricosum]
MAPRFEAGRESSCRREFGSSKVVLQGELYRLRVRRAGWQVKIGFSADRRPDGVRRELGVGGRPPSLEPELLVVLQQLVGPEATGNPDREKDYQSEERQRSPATPTLAHLHLLACAPQ